MTSAASSDSMWRRIYYSRLRDVLRGRPDARLDWRQIIASANLPGELANAVTQVVSKSRLWRSEKAAVAAELVAHFQDGLDAGQSGDRLLSAFGDFHATSQLIGRAKRRGRPIGWQIFHYGWMTTAGFALLYLMLCLWMATGRPTVRVNYLATLNKTALAVPENERAWPKYREALLAMGFREDDTHDSPAADFIKDDVKPGDAKWAQTTEFFKNHADSFAMLRDAASHEKLGFVTSISHADFTEKDRELFGMHFTPEQLEAEKKLTLEDRWLMSTLLPNLHSLVITGRLLAADAHRAAEAGDGATAYADVTALLGVSRHAQEIPFLVGVMVGDRIQSFARITIRDVLSEQPALWTDSQLHDLAHKLAGAKIDWTRGIEGERIGFYDCMQRVYTDNGNGDGRLALRVSKDQNLFQMLASVNQGDGAPGDTLLANSGLAMLTMPAANMVVASRKEMLEAFDKLTDAAQARISEPYWKLRDERPLDDDFEAEERAPLGQFRYLFVRLLLPSYDNLLKRIAITNSELDGVYVGLALELYHREHKKWPGSLAELAPQWLPEVPVDRVTGQPLHYKIVDDKPLVYSVGLDGKDDNGRAVPSENGITLPWTMPPKDKPADGDWVIWTTAKTG
jgi:hypothetical protein